MNLEINVISKETVTPSSPTPPRLQNYKLSFLDQIAPPFIMPHVFFYPSNNDNPINNNSQRSNHLKKSLSQALALFYPLAGRLVSGNDGVAYVDCNDEGVTYIEAQSKTKLLDVITNPIQENLNKLVPNDPIVTKDLFLVAQVTFFSCGGLAIGLGISHKLADALSYFMFVNTWAAITHGNIPIQPPVLECATLFPPRVLGTKTPVPKGKMDNYVTKRFVFTAEKISDLRDMYTKSTNDDEEVIHPTRIEALSTFIWTRFMVATGAKNDSSKAYAVMFPVDIRTRVVPPLSEYHFGNILLRATTVLSLEDVAVKKIRDAIRNIDGDYIAKLLEGNNSWDAIKVDGRVKMDGEIVILRFSSICRLPLYKADFGWGAPVWVGSGKIPISNVVVFTASLSGDGIEAWVNLTEENMVKFEADEKLLQYVSCNDEAKITHE